MIIYKKQNEEKCLCRNSDCKAVNPDSSTIWIAERLNKSSLDWRIHSYSNRCFLYLVRTTASMKRQRCKQLWRYHWRKTDRAHTAAPSALLPILLGGRGHHPPSRHSWAGLVHGVCTGAPPQTVDWWSVWKHSSLLYLMIWRESWRVFSRSSGCIHRSYINLFVCLFWTISAKHETCLFFK